MGHQAQGVGRDLESLGVWSGQWGLGAGLHSLQKSKAFIKKAINWYQKKKKIKQTPQEAGGGSKGRWEEGREEGP